MGQIRFDGEVAVVTGGGGGLGRAHALQFAARGAAVVVNDVGGRLDGGGGDPSPAAAVVREIESAGGRALVNGDDISTPEGARGLVEAALAAYGRIDVLVNNAGILRDRTLHKMAPEDFEAVVRVHLLGSAWCSRAAWPAMQAQGQGRIVMTTSAAGLYGNFGQSNYAAAKLGIVGLMQALKLEGERHGIRVNTVAPVALTRMTEGLAFGGMLERARPEQVSAAVLYLAWRECRLSGTVLAAGAGHYATVRIVEGPGLTADAGEGGPEFLAAHWDEISRAEGGKAHGSVAEALQSVFGPA
jgi:NAD(P)-dependent dehydrogenase (short-subunit alcohol dehydrogenase family)